MYNYDGLIRVIDELEMLDAEQRLLQKRGPHFRIVHRYREPHTPCGIREEVAAVYLVHNGQLFQVGLGMILLILFDFIARHTHLAQSAIQIERGTTRDRFYTRRHAHYSGVRRAYVRVYIERLRAALKQAFREAGLTIDPAAVLVPQETATNEVTYRLHCSVEWLHLSG